MNQVPSVRRTVISAGRSTTKELVGERAGTAGRWGSVELSSLGGHLSGDIPCAELGWRKS